MQTAGLCSTRPVAVVPYLGGLIAVAEDSRLLEYYGLEDGEWKSSPSSSWRCIVWHSHTLPFHAKGVGAPD